MKRDMDLVRKILLVLEAHEEGNAPANFSIEGYSDEVVYHHCYLMKQANLLEADDVTDMSSTSPVAVPLSMTWEGHDFLDAARDNSRWNKALEKVRSIGGNVTFGVLKALLVSMAKSQLGL
jgi:hypothetical protein